MTLSCINNDNNLNKIFETFDKKEINSSGLLCVKPKLYICNVDEKSVSKGNKYTETLLKQDKSTDYKTKINNYDEFIHLINNQ